MILEKLKIKDGLRIEIVNQDDIMKSYKNNKLVSSCMSENGKWKYTRLYNYVKDLKLFRIMKGNDLVLRSLLWSVTDGEETFKFLDRVYKSKEVPDRSDGWGYYKYIQHPTAYEQFKEHWSKFADVRNTAKQIFAEVLPNRVKIWPYMDTFEFYCPKRRLLTNCGDEITDEDAFNHYEDCFINALNL